MRKKAYVTKISDRAMVSEADKEAERRKDVVHSICTVLQSAGIRACLFLFTAYCLLFPAGSEAYIDRVVAFVDDEAITLSELDQRLEEIQKLSPDSRKEQVLDSLINKKILLREAKKYRMEAPSEEEIITEYIDMKIRAYIRVLDTDIESFYRDNRAQFPSKNIGDVRGEIETYLIEKEVNERLMSELRKLRAGSYIKIQLRDDGDHGD